jgi:dUTP pyrophosphatase
MLKVQLLSPGAKAPTIAHPGEDLGYDLYASESVTLAAKGNAMVPTGIAIECASQDGKPMGCLLRDRSSLASKRLAILAGVIDAGYRGEIKVVMENLGEQAHTIHAGDKIANMIPHPVLTGEIEVVADLAESKRKAGGFGSSGR